MPPWVKVLCAGTAGALAVVVVGADLRVLVAFPLFMAALVLVWHRTRQLPPKARHVFTYFCAAGTVSLAGAIVRFGHGQVTGAIDPLPSPADALFVAGYLLFIAGGTTFYRYRVSESEEDGWLDAFILVAAIAIVVWDLLLLPYVRDPSVLAGERVMNTIYSILTLWLLAVTVRVINSPGSRAPAYYLVGAAVSCFFLTDLLSTLEYARGWDGDYGLMMTLPVYTLFGAAIYHPSVAELTEPPLDIEPRLSVRRAAAFAVALLIPPIITVSELSKPGNGYSPAIVISGFVMAVLVTYRMFKLVGTREQMALRAEHLQSFGESLVAASDLAELNQLTVDTIADIDGSSVVGAATFARRSGHDEMDLTAARGDIARSWRELSELAEPIPSGVDGRRHYWPAGTRVISLDTVPPCALAVCTSEPLDRFQRRHLTSLLKDASLAMQTLLAREQLADRRSERRLDALVQNSGDVVAVADSITSACSYISPAATDLVKGQDAHAATLSILELLHPDDQHEIAELASHLGPGQRTPSRDVRLGGQGAEWRWFDVVIADMREHDDVEGIVINARDATERRAAQRSLAEREAHFRALVQNSTDIVAVIDQGRISYASPSVERVLGYAPDDLVGVPLEMLVVDDHRRLMSNAVAAIGRGDNQPFEINARRRDDMPLILEIVLTDLREEPAVAGIVVNARDITKPRQLELDLRHAAYHDALTGLPNRFMLEEKVSDGLRLSESEPHHIAVLFIDLDDFKDVNDGFGHEAGDKVLQTVAARLQEHTRVRDLAARLGGDEFAVLVSECYGDHELLELAKRVLEALAVPMHIAEQSVTVSASIGIASSASPSDGADDLLRDADAAMYLAKDRGKGRSELFEERLRVQAAERVELTNDMRLALETDQFFLAYQPVVCLESGGPVGVEALARWAHPTRGVISPADFIPLAEQTGLIVPLGRLLLRAACAQLAQWSTSHNALADLGVAVNLSTHQMRDGAIVDEVAAVLSQYGLDPTRLTLEVTESVLAQDPDAMLRRLNDLKAVGVRLAIDDFGTGYSSLSYLQQYPFDILKIDRAFIQDLDEQRHTAVVRTIIDLAEQLGTETVAEGIETENTLQALREMGCPKGQGFLFSRPLVVDELPDRLAALSEPQEATVTPA